MTELLSHYFSLSNNNVPWDLFAPFEPICLGASIDIAFTNISNGELQMENSTSPLQQLTI